MSKILKDRCLGLFSPIAKDRKCDEDPDTSNSLCLKTVIYFMHQIPGYHSYKEALARDDRDDQSLNSMLILLKRLPSAGSSVPASGLSVLPFHPFPSLSLAIPASSSPSQSTFSDS